MKRTYLILFSTIVFLFSMKVLQAQTLPENFYDELINDDFDIISGLVFDETGQMYTWEKRGIVSVIDTNGVKQSTPLLDLSEEVAFWRDHGLLGMVLDPNFSSNGYIYLWYIVDRHHMLYYGTPQYHPDSSWYFSSSIGRITRYTLDAATSFTTVIPDSRHILLGETKETGVPVLGSYHGGGTLLFGKDKTLLLSVGDCATGAGVDTGGVVQSTYAVQALNDGIITPDQDVGLYRCQYLGAMNGKILRIDPVTGDGIPSNPFYDAANPRSPQSRVWALGFRNPFGMTIVEGTGSHSPADGDPGTLIVGDVGWKSFEEINIVDRPALNFGWPLYEGHFTTYMYWYDAPYNRMAPNPLHATGGCNQPYFTFQDLLAKPHKTNVHIEHPCDNNGSVPNMIHRFKLEPPHVSYLNEFYENPPDVIISRYKDNGEHEAISVDDPNSWLQTEKFDGQCSLGGVIYNGSNFPEEYRGVYFHADFRGWIRAFHLDDEGKVYKIENFMDNSDDLISMAVHPKDGSLYYIGHLNEIHRISYGGNPKPVAIAESDVVFGPSPLEVHFDASNSFDLKDEPITYQWDFGNGQTSTEETPMFTFTAQDNNPEPFEVTLTVTDSIGQSAEATIIISVNNTPPVVDITSFEDGDLYPGLRSTTLPLEADVSDAESANEDLTYTWTTYLHHNTHFHPEPADNRTSTHTIISAVGCETDVFFFRVRLDVTDEHGLTTRQEQYIYPYCGNDFVEFLDLEGKTTGDNIVLNWTAAFEDSITHYEIERSIDRWNFQKIGTVTASSDQNNPNDYEFIDENPLYGLTYYRVKAYRENRAFMYSNNVITKFSTNMVDVFPNPSLGRLNFYFSDSFEKVVFTIYNSQSQKMEELTFNQVSENQFENFDFDLGSGTYFYTMNADGVVENGKLIIVK